MIFTAGRVLEIAKGRFSPELATLPGILSGSINRCS
jgi:hypothetical protein